MFILQLVVACLVIWVLQEKWRRRRFEKLYQQLKKTSALRLPFLGHFHIFFCNLEERMKQIQIIGRDAINSGGITGFWITHKLYIHVADSEVADIIMKTCIEKDDIVKCFHIVLGDGSIFAPADIWRPRRKYLAPVFGMKYLNQYVETFSKLSCHLVDNIRRVRIAGTDNISMTKIYLLYTMNAVLGEYYKAHGFVAYLAEDKCLESLNLPINVGENSDNPIFLALDEIMTTLIDRVFKPWLHNDFVYKLLPNYQKLAWHRSVIFEVLHKVIEEKRQQIGKYPDGFKKDVKTKDGMKSFLDLMIESTANPSDDAIREEGIVLITAASDTTAVSLGYSTLMLARHPDMQQKVYQELKEVIGEFDRPITPEDLPHLKYLDAFVRETLRLYPPVPLIVRKVVKNTELPSGVTLIPGCGVLINIWAINRNPTYWGEDAEEFKPERFLDPAPRHPAAFVTFSHGPRNCLGYQYAMMSIKTVIATLLNQYRILPASDDLKNEPLRVKYSMMMRHIDNYRVRFEPRK